MHHLWNVSFPQKRGHKMDPVNYVVFLAETPKKEPLIFGNWVNIDSSSECVL